MCFDVFLGQASGLPTDNQAQIPHLKHLALNVVNHRECRQRIEHIHPIQQIQTLTGEYAHNRVESSFLVRLCQRLVEATVIEAAESR